MKEIEQTTGISRNSIGKVLHQDKRFYEEKEKRKESKLRQPQTNKVNFNKNGNSYSTKINIPYLYFKKMGIDKENRLVDVIYDENKIIGMFVKFDNGLVEDTKDNYEELKLAYAISIHKSQGSEFNTTIIPFSKSYSIMLKRRLYYTAITRAKKFLIMIGSFEAFKMAVSNTDYSRNTKLKEKILEAINNYEQEIKHLKKE